VADLHWRVDFLGKRATCRNMITLREVPWRPKPLAMVRDWRATHQTFSAAIN
jgi:hypothetical protein